MKTEKVHSYPGQSAGDEITMTNITEHAYCGQPNSDELPKNSNASLVGQFRQELQVVSTNQPAIIVNATSGSGHP